MSYNIRLRRVAYDNLLVGTVASREVHTGSAGTTELLAKETFAAGGAAVRTTDGLDHIISSSGGKTTAFVDEQIENTN